MHLSYICPFLYWRHKNDMSLLSVFVLYIFFIYLYISLMTKAHLGANHVHSDEQTKPDKYKIEVT